MINGVLRVEPQAVSQHPGFQDTQSLAQGQNGSSGIGSRTGHYYNYIIIIVIFFNKFQNLPPHVRSPYKLISLPCFLTYDTLILSPIQTSSTIFISS